jgi:hypothetical protein
MLIDEVDDERVAELYRVVARQAVGDNDIDGKGLTGVSTPNRRCMS